mgnify:FL=1
MELYPNKNGTVNDLLEEAKKQIEFSEDSSRELRLLEVVSNKINYVITNDILLECLNATGTKSYRIEEIPKDQLKMEPNEFLLPVAHFQKESYHTFGVPFLLKVKNVSLSSISHHWHCLSFSVVSVSNHDHRKKHSHRSRKKYRKNSTYRIKNMKRLYSNFQFVFFFLHVQ